MERLQRAAVMLSLIDKLRGVGSWSGETHVQKATYVLQELLGVPLGYDFALYKHGPYSFSLSDDITALRADAVLRLEPKPYPYRPSIVADQESKQIAQRYPKTMARYDPVTDFVARRLGPMRVAELERIATAFYVTREQDMSHDVESRAQRIHQLKPHVTLEQAREAVKQVETLIVEARDVEMQDVWEPEPQVAVRT